MTRRCWLLGLVALRSFRAFAAEAGSLDGIRAEADLEKRSKLATEFARDAVKEMEEAYFAGERERGRGILEKILAAVRLSQESLEETGKSARKRPKHFKRAEISTRKLIQDLTNVQRQLTFDERTDLDPVIEELEEINRGLLMDIMRRKER